MGSSSSSVAAAEVAVLRARAAAEAARAEADVAAKRALAAATTMRAEADAAAKRALLVERAAEAAGGDIARRLRAARALGVAAVIFAPLAWLARDYYVHESRTYIRRRMLQTLRECRLPPSVDAQRPPLLPAAQQPLTLGLLPTMLLGPTGCGKSTLLADLARTAVAPSAPAPTVFVRLRVPVSEGAAGPVGEGATLLDSAAAQFYEQIGYPRRRSFLGSVLSRGATVMGELTQVELAPESTRLIDALGLLFSVCEELRFERVAAGISALDAAPVLLFDEVQDLIKDVRLKNAGGSLVFQTLATLIVAYGVDRGVVRVVAAGSSAELFFAFQATTAKGNRWSVITLADPAHDTVEGALEARGYSRDEARKMIALCGTRMRLLREPLEKGPAACSAAVFVESVAASGCAAIESVFARLDAESAARLARALDSVAAADAAGDARGARPTKEALPRCMHDADVSSALYVTPDRRLFFQSRAVARAWADTRGDHAGAAPSTARESALPMS